MTTKKEIDKRYYQKNRDKVLKSVKKYYNDHKENISMRKKKWYQLRLFKTKKKKVEDLQCPVCGYYCNGKGGVFCIDKPSLMKEENI
jgi:rubrerythrin